LFRATCYSPGGGYKLSAVGHAELADNIIPKLRNLPPNAKIVVYGYTDNSPVGAALKQQGIPDNLVLSTRRAAAVANFLISQGIPADSVSAQGFGDTRPVASNDTPQVRAQNRRIEVAVTARGTPPILASRLFAGPTQYPPTDFAAYGIVAFKTRATAEDKPRYEMICNAYVAGLLHVSDVKVPVNAALARRECEASAESQGAERDRPRCGRHASSQAPVHRGGGHALMSEPVCCRLCAGGNRIRTCMGLFLSSGVLVCWRFFVRSGKAVLRPVACDQVRGARGRGQGTETLAELSGLPLSGACVSQPLNA
jgi:hypothetical protein